VAGTLLALATVCTLLFALAAWRSNGHGGDPDMTLFLISQVLSDATWPLLLAACLAGFGRDTEERLVPPSKMFVVRGERRLRVAEA